MPISRTLIASLGLGAIAMTAAVLSATAGGHGANPAVAARQGHMNIMQLNISVLGNMARGRVDYDAEAAQAAADNLVALLELDPRFYWLAGTDSDSIDGTNALPAIWEDFAGFGAIWGEYAETSTALAAVAGDGLDAMRGAIGPLGQACGDCHDDYRVAQ